MMRLILGAALAAGAAALILLQMQGTAELALWEVLLLVLVVLQYRGIPNRGDPLGEPLFRLPKYEPKRLPRDVAATELAVIDATSGYLSPERRLKPVLRRVTEHRLGRRGLTMQSPGAAAALGQENWNTLMSEDDGPIDLAELESLVERLEHL